MAAPAREAAFRALRALASNRVDLGDALSRARDPLSDVRDRALATELVLGTLRWRNAIDFQVQQFSTKRLDRLDDEVLDAVRLGGYQIMYLHRVPVSAVVNDMVAIVKTSRFRSASGFANAVLRRLARERESLSWPARPATVTSDADRHALIEHLSVVQSHPAWLVRRWVMRYGATETETWLRFNNEPPALTIAANLLRGSRSDLAARLRSEGVETIPTSIAPHGLSVRSGQVLASRAFSDGECVVQDEASQVIPELVGASNGQRIFDACASPGAKTLALAAQGGRSSLVIAADVRPRRLRLLTETLRRCGVPNVRVVHTSDSDHLPFRDGSFHRVLVDAPCSGLGTVRRDPDIRWRRREEDVPTLAAEQLALLRRVAPLVAPGGRLVYSTCSSEPEENEHVVSSFLAAMPRFKAIPLSNLNVGERIRQMATPEGYLRTTPRFGLEAFFAAILTTDP